VRPIVGIGLFSWRQFVCLPIIAILPVSLMGDETGNAMLRSSGGVLVNKNPAPASAALFPNDLIETQKNVVARIEAAGSTADINPETMLQFEGDTLVLDHGSLSVNTSRVLRVRVGCVTVTPVNAEWTHYDVTDVDGKVTVSALKNDVYIDSRSTRPQDAKQPSHSNRTIVREGEQKSREEKCGAAILPEPHLAGIGPIMNSPWAIGTGAVAIGVITCFALCQNDNPVSPAKP
jgi:hypothetical protein